MGIFDCSRWRAQKKHPLAKICHTYPTMMKLGTGTPCLKKIQNIYGWCDTLLNFCWHQYFFTGNQQTLLYQKIQIQIAFRYVSSNSFNFFRFFKDFNKHDSNFDDVNKNSYSWRHQQNLIKWLKLCCICGHVTNILVTLGFLWEKLSRPQFYKDLTRLSWLKINNLGLVLAMTLKYYIGMEKELKLKVTK